MICGFLPEIYGFNKSSESGPDAFAPSIFLKNCQLRCPYCMNSRLVMGDVKSEFSLEDVKTFVRENNCKSINISGGEPLHRSIFEVISLIEELGNWNCKISLSTNGLEVEKLTMILPSLSYVTLDIKTDKSRYDNLLAEKENWKGARLRKCPFTNVTSTLEKLRNKKHFHESFGYEVRTTLYPPLVDEKAIREIGRILFKGEKWMLQPFRKTKTMLSNKANEVAMYDNKEIKRLADIAREYTDDVQIRDV